MASVIIGEYFIDYSLSGEIREFTKNGNPVGTDEQKRIGRIIAERQLADGRGLSAFLYGLLDIPMGGGEA